MDKELKGTKNDNIYHSKFKPALKSFLICCHYKLLHDTTVTRGNHSMLKHSP